MSPPIQLLSLKTLATSVRWGNKPAKRKRLRRGYAEISDKHNPANFQVNQLSLKSSASFTQVNTREEHLEPALLKRYKAFHSQFHRILGIISHLDIVLSVLNSNARCAVCGNGLSQPQRHKYQSSIRYRLNICLVELGKVPNCQTTIEILLQLQSQLGRSSKVAANMGQMDLFRQYKRIALTESRCHCCKSQLSGIEIGDFISKCDEKCMMLAKEIL